MTDPRRAIEFLLAANALESVPRTGFVMSGIEPAESVAAHVAGMGAAALLIADRVGEPVDRGRILTMVLLHDIGEVVVGDVALIDKTPEDDEREEAAARELVRGLPPAYLEALEEFRAQETLESRIAKAADKLQMMAKIVAYEREGRGDLEAFWGNPRNFHDAGLPAAKELFDEIREMRQIVEPPATPG